MTFSSIRSTDGTLLRSNQPGVLLIFVICENKVELPMILSKCFISKTALLTVIIFLTLISFSSSQEAKWVSLNADTDIDHAIVCSPDGRNLYAAGLHTIAAFKWNGDSLEVLQILNNDHLGVRGMRNITDLAISPEGRHLYALNQNGPNLLLFAREPITGTITLSKVITDSVFGAPGAIGPLIEAYYRLLMASDGRALYWLSQHKGVLAVFARDLQTGGLTRVQVLRNGDPSLGQFNIPYWITDSPDGQFIYAGGGNGTNMLIFSRAFETTQITLKNFQDMGRTPDGRWDGGRIVVSLDGKSLYATVLFYKKLLVFTRDSLSGEVKLLQTINRNAPKNLMVSPNNRYVYFQHYDQASYFAFYSRDDSTGILTEIDNHALEITFQAPSPSSGICMSSQGDAIFLVDAYSRHTVIKRDTLTGQLTFVQQFNNNIGGTDLLHNSSFVEASPTGDFVYVAARDADDGVSVFARNPDDGRLTQAASYPIPHLQAMSMAPEGKHIYVTTQVTAQVTPYAIDIFARDERTGLLQHLARQPDSSGASWIGLTTISADGRHLYAHTTQSLSMFKRDLTTGRLAFKQRLIGADYNLIEMTAFALSPDGVHLYWAGEDPSPRTGDYQIAILNRDAATGEISFEKIKKIGGLYPNASIRISADGHYLYLPVIDCEGDGNLLAVFSRDILTGDLTSTWVYSFPGWCRGVDVAIAPNGTDLYFAIDSWDAGSGMVVMFEQSLETGLLTQRAAFRSWQDGVYGIFQPRALALSPDAKHLYMADLVGVATFATGRNATSVANKSEPLSTLPRSLKLEQNYPNPLSTLAASASNGTPVTIIRYEIPATKNPATRVELTIYNLQGQLVSTLVNESKAPGQYSVTWDGTNVHGKQAPSGIYFYCIKAGEHLFTRKLTIVR